jgi:hypothetical protein
MRIRTFVFAAIAVIGMGMTFAVAPAQAVQKSRHCVINVSDANARVACYDSFAKAMATAQTVGPIEIAWEGPNYEGSSLVFTSDRGCTLTLDDIDFSAPNVGFGIRSYRNYRGCVSKHYELPNFEGRSVGWDSGGQLPFPARSVQWS